MTDDAVKGDRDDAEHGAEGAITHARELADAAVKVERVKADIEALLPPRPARVGAVKGNERSPTRLFAGSEPAPIALFAANSRTARTLSKPC